MLDILFIILGIELGCANGGYAVYNPPFYYADFNEKRYYIEFNIELMIYKYVYLKGSIKIPFYQEKDEINFWPTALFSLIEIGIKFNGLKIGYKRDCKHPIIPYERKVSHRSFYDEAEDIIFIRYETNKIKIF